MGGKSPTRENERVLSPGRMTPPTSKYFTSLDVPLKETGATLRVDENEVEESSGTLSKSKGEHERTLLTSA
jgi:hypothetical protein